MLQEFLRCAGCATRFEVFGTGDALAAQRRDAARDQIRVRKIAHAHGGVETFADEIDKAVAVGGVHVQLRMTAGEIGQHRREVRRTEGQRRGDAKATADFAFGRDRVARGFEARRRRGRHARGSSRPPRSAPRRAWCAQAAARRDPAPVARGAGSRWTWEVRAGGLRRSRRLRRRPRRKCSNPPNPAWRSSFCDTEVTDSRGYRPSSRNARLRSANRPDRTGPTWRGSAMTKSQGVWKHEDAA